MFTQNQELLAFLKRLPETMSIKLDTVDFLDKEIRKGLELNALQRQSVFDLIKWCIENTVIPPPPLESLSAYTYQEWSDLAKTGEEWKPKLASLVKLLKSNPQAAPKVSQTVQQMLKQREARRGEHLKVVEALAAAGDAVHDAPKQNNKVQEAANVWIKRMQAARMGFGESAMPNMDLACTIAEEAVGAHPNNPKVVFEAAGCHHLQATKGKGLATLDRYVHMRQADTHYQKCYALLTALPYSKLKGEYDKWRSGLSQLIIKVQEELKKLDEKQK